MLFLCWIKFQLLTNSLWRIIGNFGILCAVAAENITPCLYACTQFWCKEDKMTRTSLMISTRRNNVKGYRNLFASLRQQKLTSKPSIFYITDTSFNCGQCGMLQTFGLYENFTKNFKVAFLKCDKHCFRIMRGQTSICNKSN